ncbi:hypothetical protein [Streptomyces sp. NPDC048442]|uniref:hypothetical protein n=1 Tax=Streptomyces sp. NPDC048442 TaxID=3154823 RepID=UPI0034403566
MELETYEVSGGQVLAIGSRFFFVRESREPASGIFPGLTFWGYWWNHAQGVWGSDTPLSAPFNARKWHALEPDHAESIFPALPGPLS